MRNFLFSFLAVLLFTTSLPSRAVVGGVFAVPAISWVGLAMTAPSGLFIFAKRNTSNTSDIFWMFMAVPVLLAGLVVLDAEEGQAVGFNSIEKNLANKLKITEAERLSFNAELDQVNALLQEATVEISAINNASAKDAQIVWNNLSENVSAEAFSAMQKISTQMVK